MKNVIYSSISAIIWLMAILLNSCQSGPALIENEHYLIEFREDLNGLSKLIDKKTGRNYASDQAVPLYSLGFDPHYKSGDSITTLDATKRRFKKTNNRLELHFTHMGERPLQVICTINGDADSSLVYWDIKVENGSEDILSTIEYPVLPCVKLDASGDTRSGVLYPFLEGVLLTGMNEEGAFMKHEYPGQLSSQLMYHFNPEGGIYYASYDGEGYKKALSVKNENQSVILSQVYFLPIEYKKEVEVPYPVVTGFAGGRWEEGASIYRGWAKGQEWCERKFKDDEDITAWLKSPNLFVNFNYTAPAFSTVEKANQVLKNYRDFFQMPIIATGFGWEKNEIWVGPDYFPPIHGFDYYKTLSGLLKERGDHLHMFTSGFRWTIRKPKYFPDGTEGFTDYDGTAAFLKSGTGMAVIRADGEMWLDKRAWAHNYILCPGAEAARVKQTNTFKNIFNMGVTGVDIDQNLGGEVDACFSDKHGHPLGSGIWQHEAMRDFLSTTRAEGKMISADIFMGVEEPCEIYIPYLDIFHGRSYTDTEWPVMGPGGVAVPLFIYLYHPYQIGYSGWIDPAFSPFRDERYGLGRSFIFGMYPGVRVADNYDLTTGLYSNAITTGKFSLMDKTISDEMKTLKAYTELMKAYPEFLVHGEMNGEADIEGSAGIALDENVKRIPLPVSWKEVQGIGWLSDQNDAIAYALTNLSGKEYNGLIIKLDGKAKGNAEFIYYDYNAGSVVKVPITNSPDGLMEFSLKPWQIGIIRVEFQQRHSGG